MVINYSRQAPSVAVSLLRSYFPSFPPSLSLLPLFATALGCSPFFLLANPFASTTSGGIESAKTGRTIIKIDALSLGREKYGGKQREREEERDATSADYSEK